MRSLASFYHLYADGIWEEAVREYWRALEVSGFQGPCYVGIVGSLENQRKVKSVLPSKAILITAEREFYGHEQTTLNVLQRIARHSPSDRGILYAHTKGTTYSADSPGAQSWRHAMVHETVMAHEAASIFLEEFDVVGAGWQDSATPHFFGNFWWARADYIARLGPVGNNQGDRYEAELWLGTGNPRVKDLCPDFRSKHAIGWNHFTKRFGVGRECANCSLTETVVY